MIKNAKELPKRYFGLHMVPGVAEYADPQLQEGKPYRILIEEDCLKNMDPSFEGKPLYVKHVDEVNLDELETLSVGTVVRSFYNPPDGKHWVEFMVEKDAGHEAIRSGWKLSNAYLPKTFGGGGRWHNVDYSKEVLTAEYEHLALVPNPRYEESIVLTPEQFKAYNSEKESELLKLANSKEENSMFTWFKKSKVENAAEIEEMSVTLSNGISKSIKQLVNEAEEAVKKDAEEKKEPPMAHPDHMVQVGDAKMSVKDMVEKYNAMMSKHDDDDMQDDDEKKKDAGEQDEEAKKKALELAEHEEKEIKAKKEQDEAKMEQKKKNQSYFDALKNAGAKESDAVVELSEDRVARGKARYGSGA